MESLLPFFKADSPIKRRTNEYLQILNCVLSTFEKLDIIVIYI
jgi:hypothetical protein